MMMKAAGRLYCVVLLLGFCQATRWQKTSQLDQHHTNNNNLESHLRKVRRLQRQILHNNKHSMKFRPEEQEELGKLSLRSCFSILAVA
jgi:hypothetical protein